MLNQLDNPVAWQIIVASIFDLMFADPYWFPHPVRGMGKLIQYGEIILRRIPIYTKLSGIVLVLFVTACSYFATHCLIIFCSAFGNMLQMFISAVLIYFTLSIRGLVKEAQKIVVLLEVDDINGARKQLANIVGRDTANMDKDQIKCACIESLAENIVDGVLSPLFYAFIGGAPLAMAYKSVNTMDSMIGYKNEKYIEFGWAAARLDDLANYLPARISRFVIPAAAFLCGASPYKSFKISMSDGQKHPSPNSGISEAAFAGALSIQMGGESFYNGVRSVKPFIGRAEESLSLLKIKKSIHIVYVSSFISIFLGFVILSIFN